MIILSGVKGRERERKKGDKKNKKERQMRFVAPSWRVLPEDFGDTRTSCRYVARYERDRQGLGEGVEIISVSELL